MPEHGSLILENKILTMIAINWVQSVHVEWQLNFTKRMVTRSPPGTAPERFAKFSTNYTYYVRERIRIITWSVMQVCVRNKLTLLIPTFAAQKIFYVIIRDRNATMTLDGAFQICLVCSVERLRTLWEYWESVTEQLRCNRYLPTKHQVSRLEQIRIFENCFLVISRDYSNWYPIVQKHFSKYFLLCPTEHVQRLFREFLTLVSWYKTEYVRVATASLRIPSGELLNYYSTS